MRFAKTVGIWTVAWYIIVSLTVYRFRHPEKTETELFLEIPAALIWR